MVRLHPTHRYVYSCQHLQPVIMQGTATKIKEAEEEEPYVIGELSEEEAGEVEGKGSSSTPMRRCTAAA